MRIDRSAVNSAKNGAGGGAGARRAGGDGVPPGFQVEEFRRPPRVTGRGARGLGCASVETCLRALLETPSRVGFPQAFDGRGASVSFCPLPPLPLLFGCRTVRT